MALSILPFGNGLGKTQSKNSLKLTGALKEAAERSPFLAEYIRRLPLDEIAMPSYHDKLERSMSGLEYRNLIYSIGEGLFIHIYPDKFGSRDHYVAIEPDIVVDIEAILLKVEKNLVIWAEQIGEITEPDEKRRFLLQLIDQICTTDRDATIPNRKRLELIFVDELELEAIRYRVIRDKVGLGMLQPLLLDPYIEDISCSGIGHIFVEHKIFKSVQSSIAFSDHDDLDEFVVWLGEWIKSPVTVRNPLVDAVLPDGSRINIVYGREISKRGSNFTIRKAPGTPLSVLELVSLGSLDYNMAAYLSFMLEEGMNVFVVGATASGKTTLLNAITAFIPSEAKIVSIEDTPEVQVPHNNWVQESTRHGGSSHAGSQVGMLELLKAALRQRPDMIIVGEIRSVEAAVAFQAMQTGHAVMSTFHAATVEKLIQRLTGDPINIPKTYIDNLNIVIIQSAVRLPNGKSARRVMSINEIIGYDPVSQSFSFLEAFRWNSATDTFEFPGYMNSYMLENLIATQRGIPPSKRKSIYNELKRRAKILEKLNTEKKVTDYYELFKILTEARKKDLL